MLNKKLWLIVILALFIECNKQEENIFKQKEVKLDTLNTIEIYNQFEVYLKQDSVNKIVAEANDNLLKYILITQNDSTVTIENTYLLRFLQDKEDIPKIYLHLTNLRNLFIHGPCNVYSQDTLKYKELLIRVHGEIAMLDLKIKNYFFWLEYWTATGDAYISGETTFFETFVNGYAYVHAQDLKANYIKVTQKSTGDYYVQPLETLTVWLEEIGNIYYTGEPTEVNIVWQKSSGKLIKL